MIYLIRVQLPPDVAGGGGEEVEEEEVEVKEEEEEANCYKARTKGLEPHIKYNFTTGETGALRFETITRLVAAVGARSLR